LEENSIHIEQNLSNLTIDENSSDRVLLDLDDDSSDLNIAFNIAESDGKHQLIMHQNLKKLKDQQIVLAGFNNSLPTNKDTRR